MSLGSVIVHHGHLNRAFGAIVAADEMMSGSVSGARNLQCMSRYVLEFDSAKSDLIAEVTAMSSVATLCIEEHAKLLSVQISLILEKYKRDKPLLLCDRPAKKARKS